MIYSQKNNTFVSKNNTIAAAYYCSSQPFIYKCVQPICLPPKIATYTVFFASEMTYIVSGGALNSTHSLTHSRLSHIVF